MVYCMQIIGLLIVNIFQMQIGQNPRLMRDLLQDTVSLLEGIWFPREERSRR